MHGCAYGEAWHTYRACHAHGYDDSRDRTIARCAPLAACPVVGILTLVAGALTTCMHAAPIRSGNPIDDIRAVAVAATARASTSRTRRSRPRQSTSVCAWPHARGPSMRSSSARCAAARARSRSPARAPRRGGRVRAARRRRRLLVDANRHDGLHGAVPVQAIATVNWPLRTSPRAAHRGASCMRPSANARRSPRGLDRRVRLVEARARRGDGRGLDVVGRIATAVGGARMQGVNAPAASVKMPTSAACRERRAASDGARGIVVFMPRGRLQYVCHGSPYAPSMRHVVARASGAGSGGNASPKRAARAARFCRSTRPTACATAARRGFAELARSLLESPRRRALCTQD